MGVHVCHCSSCYRFIIYDNENYDQCEVCYKTICNDCVDNDMHDSNICMHCLFKIPSFYVFRDDEAFQEIYVSNFEDNIIDDYIQKNEVNLEDFKKPEYDIVNKFKCPLCTTIIYKKSVCEPCGLKIFNNKCVSFKNI